MNCVECSCSPCCHGHVVYFFPLAQVCFFKTRDFFLFCFLASEKFPFSCKMLLFFFCFCGCCYGERGRLCYLIQFVGSRAFACVSAVFVHSLGFACWISLQRQKNSYWMLLIWEHKSSYALNVSVRERVRACICLRVYVYILCGGVEKANG